MAKLVPTGKTGKSLPLSLTKALQMTQPKVAKQRRQKFLENLFVQQDITQDLEHWNLIDFVSQHPSAAQKVQQKYNLRWVIVQKQPCRTKIKLVYDGSHAVVKNESSPVHFFLLGKNKMLKQHSINGLKDMPPLSPIKSKKIRNKNQKPLGQLLGLAPCSTQDPQTTDELEAFLKNHTPPQTKVFVNFIFSPITEGTVPWIEMTNSEDGPINNVIQLVAWTQDCYTVVYSEKTDLSLSRDQKRGKKIEVKFAHYQEKLKEIQKKAKEIPDPFQSNCTASINLAHSGLNLAHYLGLIQTVEELSQFSTNLVKTHSSLYVFLDEQNHLRHITYYDQEHSFSVQVTCYEENVKGLDQYQHNLNKQRQEKAAQTMLEFWKQVWDRRQYWIKQRQEYLKPLTNRLENILTQSGTKSMSSPYSRCWTNLKKIVGHQQVYMFSNQDAHLHSIKFFLTDFIFQTFKKCRGVSVKASSDSTLTMLCISGMTLINLHTYFDSKSDADFFAKAFDSSGYNPSTTAISHINKHLERESLATNQQTTLLMHCKKTGKQCAKHILNYWSLFGQYLLAQFFFEVHGLVNLPSASYLAFQCVWTAYAKTAGPLAQAMEKCKPHHETLLRQESRGGFMFSIEDALNQGDALWPEEESFTTQAQSIAEMDLVSAYGYAASKAYMPSGFCTGYTKGNKNLGQSLSKLDLKARHKSFEFRAVYKVLHDLIQRDGIGIRAVYSNFSPLGLFCLGSYPIDLAVITLEGKLLLYQMDGLWCHGCPICPDQPHLFANSQTYQEVRQKTNQRDKETKHWIDAMNAAVGHSMIQYTIIYDCHSPGFSTEALDFFFQTVPELAHLVQGYQIMDLIGSRLSKATFESMVANHSEANYTFIAKATIDVLNKARVYTDGPLVVYQSREKKYTKQSLSFSGTVVLTRDYYEWLKKSFQRVLIQDLEWVLFYKTEPVFNQIYSQLTSLRSTSTDPVLISFLKRKINLSCGFFGAHTSQQDKTTYRLVDGLPKNYAFFRHNLNFNYTTEIGPRSYILLETKALPKVSSYHKPSNSAIPMFVAIVEYGKLRLVQILHFLQQHVDPSRFRLLYSNIDNLVYALGDADTLEEALEPQYRASFFIHKDQFLAGVKAGVVVKTPGMAALEWIRNTSCGWKFISIRTQHYCLVVSNAKEGGNLHKTSGWTNVSSQEAYNLALKMLRGNPVSLVQTRRVNKKCNMDTRQVTFNYV